eukprot:5060042-Pleurochrysis_carterae.AAC.2
MDLQNARFDDCDCAVVNVNRVEEVHSVRSNELVHLTLCDLLVQSLTQLGSHAAGVVDRLRLRLSDVADHGLTRGWCAAELHVRSIAWKGINGRHRERHGIALPVEEHLIAQKSQDASR